MTVKGPENTQETSKERKNTGRDCRWENKFLDVTAIVALVTASGYIVGYSYFFSFFERLSVPRFAISLPPVQYMSQAFAMFSIVALAIFPAALVARHEPSSFSIAIVGNLPIFAFGATVIFSYIRDHRWVMFAMSIAMVFLTLLVSYRRASLAHYLYRSPRRGVVTALFGMIVFAIILAAIAGRTHATMLIQGASDDAVKVKLFDESGKSILDDDDYVLVFMDGRSYYLVKRESPPQASPKLLIVARDDVKIAIIRRLGSVISEKEREMRDRGRHIMKSADQPTKQ